MPHPNFEVREVSTTPSIQTTATSTTAFLGAAIRGPLKKATQVRSLAGFKRLFGNLRNDFELGHALAQFFRNGGNDPWVVRIPAPPTLAKIKEALAALDAVDVINLLVLPGLTRSEWIDAALDYAVGRRLFVIIDPPKNAVTPSALLTQLARRAFPNGANGAIFFPWVKIVGSGPGKQLRLSAPSGTIAGLLARNDRDAGIWKAASGKTAMLNGVLGLACDLTQTEIEDLHANGINALRKFPSNGFVSWSARTLAGTGESQSEWKYIPVRRLALFIEESIARGTQWVVFEPNSESLWACIRSSTEAFLQDLFQQGAFAGRTPKDAFFVKCDRTTMTQDEIDNGRLHVVIGIAPLKPAEFVIFRIGQWTCARCT